MFFFLSFFIFTNPLFSNSLFSGLVRFDRCSRLEDVGLLRRSLCSAEVVCVSSWGSTLTPAYGNTNMHEARTARMAEREGTVLLKVRKAIPSLVGSWQMQRPPDQSRGPQTAVNAMPRGRLFGTSSPPCTGPRKTVPAALPSRTSFLSHRPHALHVTVGMVNFLTSYPIIGPARWLKFG